MKSASINKFNKSTRGASDKVKILDSTLRDGTQGEGISYSLADKISVVKKLDALGVDYIEAGNPASNPKDMKLFHELSSLKLKNSKIVAFGNTRHKNFNVTDDKTIQSLLDAKTDVICVFGKSWDYHVENVLKTTLDENLSMIFDTIKYLKSKKREVIYDAEHFFDGFKASPDYALSTILSAAKAGADCVCLCDTNGGAFPSEVYNIIKAAIDFFNTNDIKTQIGVHCHNDIGCAVASSIAGVEAGATHVQGTLLGFGERCGNANLSTVVANLQLKMGYNCIPKTNIENLTLTCAKLAEITNVSLDKTMPYVGKSAYAHKAGMHADAVIKSTQTFEHIPPSSVGNERRFLVSEMAGRSIILKKILKINENITRDSDELKNIVAEVKRMESEGYNFEGADASFEILACKELGIFKPKFDVLNYVVVSEDRTTNRATIKIKVGDTTETTGEEGHGPVNALDNALRKALIKFFPSIKSMHLKDFKVRILEGKIGTASVTRVLMDFEDKHETWTTIGVSDDIIMASFKALMDAYEYRLQRLK
ncbi:MAG: citramalate synthase [Clostridiales bacterium]|jgi:2-isopropylmalate synthase|nr:citramalate synthase [Clostridiales bacterium]